MAGFGNCKLAAQFLGRSVKRRDYTDISEDVKKSLGPPVPKSDQPPKLNRPALKYRTVTSEDRSKALEMLATAIAMWDVPHPRPSSPGKKIKPAKRTWYPSEPTEAALKRKARRRLYSRFAKKSDAAVVVMPEGYGKSFLLVYLIARGFKIVFCTKSNAQLLQKEREITEKWVEKDSLVLPEIKRLLHRMPTTTRYVSRLQNLQEQLELLGIGPDVFKISSNPPLKNPYAIATLNEKATVSDLASVFKQRGLNVDAEEFFETHYGQYEPPRIDGASADVTLTTFAAFQGFCTSERYSWWGKLGLVASVRPVAIDEENLSRFSKRKKVGVGDIVEINVPFERIAVIIDDPDRDDVDWLRRVTPEDAKELAEKRASISTRSIAMESPSYWMKKGYNTTVAAIFAKGSVAENEKRRNTPIYKIEEIRGSHYVERPIEATLGYGFKKGNLKPKMIITTTELVTAHYTHRTIERSGLKVSEWVDVFRTVDCDVTAISATITRKANHAVLLPIIELLKEEFPTENVALIADGLSCQFNLSNSKGRDDLKDKTTVIKLSWPHPHAIAKAMVHLGVLAKERQLGGFDGHDQMVAVLLGDLANQALGRNQGFRYAGRQAILLVDPKWYPVIVGEGVLRYRLNPWSSELPSFNKATSKKSALSALQMSAGQSALERRLIELIQGFREFGLSADATRLVQKLPDRQQKHFQKWLGEAIAEIPQLEETKAKRRKDNTEAVRRCRERKKAALA